MLDLKASLRFHFRVLLKLDKKIMIHLSVQLRVHLRVY